MDRRRRKRRPAVVAWYEALDGEVGYWAGRIRACPEGVARRCDPTTRLQAEVAGLIEAPLGSTVRILDAGAGPMTFLGKVHVGYALEITPVDALADEYNRLLDEVGVQPPVRTQPGETERLTEMFASDHFDIAYARNALDHTYDPVRSIRELVHCVKPGAPVLLVHARDVAELEDYLGLHQWNFRIEDDGRVVVWRPGTRTDLRAVLRDIASIEKVCTGDPDDRHPIQTIVIRKHGKGYPQAR